MSSWVLSRLDRETRCRHAPADHARVILLSRAITRDRYRAFLSRVYGFEAPAEAALLATRGLDELIELRSRTQLKLLKADLRALGLPDPTMLPRCRLVAAFPSPVEALGWMYALDRSLLFHGLIHRHLETRLPREIAIAGTYLSLTHRAYAARMRELGAVLDGAATTLEIVARIEKAAHAALRCQSHWFAETVPPSMQAA